MPTKINVQEELGIKKPIEVKFTNKNMLKTIKLQRSFSKMDVLEAEMIAGSSDDGYLDLFEDTVNEAIDYVSEILKIDREKIEELEFTETLNLAMKIVGSVMDVKPVPAKESKEPKDLKA